MLQRSLSKWRNMRGSSQQLYMHVLSWIYRIKLSNKYVQISNCWPVCAWYQSKLFKLIVSMRDGRPWTRSRLKVWLPQTSWIHYTRLNKTRGAIKTNRIISTTRALTRDGKLIVRLIFHHTIRTNLCAAAASHHQNYKNAQCASD